MEMPRRPKPKPDNPEQFKRFIETAREVGAEEQDERFDLVLRTVAKRRKTIRARKDTTSREDVS